MKKECPFESLAALGWTGRGGSASERVAVGSHRVWGRVVEQQRGMSRVAVAFPDVPGMCEMWAEVAGRMLHETTSALQLPTVGDFVVVRTPSVEGPGVIEEVLPRRTLLLRKVVWTGQDGQSIAANVDRAFIVVSATPEFNPRRIERYLVVMRSAGIEPFVVLNKVDLVEDRSEFVSVLERLVSSFVMTSTATQEGVDRLTSLLSPRSTSVFVGSSGVGKSSLVNVLLGHEALVTQQTSDPRLGRHTTTARHLLLLPGGGLVIDTPGMREFGLWEEDAHVDDDFPDVTRLAAACRFRDCQHESEPGCAVLAAIAAGVLDAGRLKGMRKLQRETARVAATRDRVEKERQKRVWKNRTREGRLRRKGKEIW